MISRQCEPIWQFLDALENFHFGYFLRVTYVVFGQILMDFIHIYL